MPGAIAHMLSARQAQRIASEHGAGLVAECAGEYPAWLQAGAIAPDYSCLYQIIPQDRLDEWSGLLHEERSGDAIRAGVEWLCEHMEERDSEAFRKSVAWLAGYLSHIVFDATIHPVVHAIVGEYDRNWIDHRRCEMLMDAYICNHHGGFAEVLAGWEGVLRQTSDAAGEGLDDAIKEIWSYMLERAYPEAYGDNPPAFDEWHRDYLRTIVDACPEGVFFRHSAPGTAYIYLEHGKLSKDASLLYIENCPAPENNRFGRDTMHYDEVFRFGVSNVLRYWGQLETALASGDASMPDLPNWNLDHGGLPGEEKVEAALWI